MAASVAASVADSMTVTVTPAERKRKRRKELQRQRVPELRHKLQKIGLSTGGLKKDLVDRLLANECD